ncbi:transcriptional repressor [Dyella sp. ASV21]|jgi:Fur family ferric uptake transcriptional regulator|uniref:Fur family transcriptional regulator n=1 Tax=Dyella sp. ASV21 TaxID=2795114 RepID=UPI0018EAFE9C|nr:transcriptional repressor [Dyella sp. ASV21]
MADVTVAMTTDAREMLARAGWRVTPPRVAIWQVLCDATDEPDAVEILRRARLWEPRTSLGTVYRFLRDLEQRGLAACRLLPHQRARWRIGSPEPSAAPQGDPVTLAAITQLAAAFGYRLIPNTWHRAGT